jgi:putative hydrolase of the HAD superfamily
VTEFMEENPFAEVRAIFFDYDDTLVEFKEVSRRAIKSVASDIYFYFIDEGINLDLGTVERKLLKIADELDEAGVYDRSSWWRRLLEELGLNADPNALNEWTSLYWSITSHNSPYEDGLRLLEFLKSKNYKLGIITNSDGAGGDKRKRISLYPGFKYFDVVVIGGEGGIEAKPSLEPFLIACERVNLPQSRCLMVGDHPLKDCLPARKAGLKTILLDRGNAVKEGELYSDMVVNSLIDLEDLL